ncbi:uncharacterized protein LOC110092032 isoform X5 [Dendrobium catenatum]|uniref:uncharacterized protein LOC110092032 isoform X5 n=1 Tax=Dendrobium catenatum TaxID=906689 RepID=UPI00109EECEA|nr:uncharacterized protein LOC110092032 isoform X5 [Dendrobium catenatum]
MNLLKSPISIRLNKDPNSDKVFFAEVEEDFIQFLAKYIDMAVLFSKAPHQAQPAGPSCIQPGGRPKPTHPAHRPACISSGREVFLFESTSLHRKPPSSPPDLLASLLVDGLNPPIQLTDRLASGREATAVPNAPFIFLKLVCFILHTWHALSNHKLSGCSSPSSSFILQHKLDTGARELKNDYKALYEH